MDGGKVLQNIGYLMLIPDLRTYVLGLLPSPQFFNIRVDYYWLRWRYVVGNGALAGGARFAISFF
jgi:hypothetical protein